jgi:tRNA-dihydrouridine synthase
MIRVRGLSEKNPNTWERINFKDPTPVAIQLIGEKELYFKRFLHMFEPHKGFKGFNLNIGCPNPEFIKLGQGCALIRRIQKTRKLIKIFRDYKYGISIKMRLGMNQFDKEKKVYLNLINAVDADFFIVHGRHCQETYENPSDFSIYTDCVKTGKDIIANGDIHKKAQITLLKDIGVKGAMIGRAAIKDPSIFNRLKGLEHNRTDAIKEFLELSRKYNERIRYEKNIIKHNKSNNPV